MQQPSLPERPRLADRIAERLERLGVGHVFGVGGANIEDLFAAIERRRPRLRIVLAKHEHGAGTAADAYARVTGRLGVVCTTSGGGALNLVHAMAEARASSVPVLAIVGEPPTSLQGRGAFQDTSGRNGAIDAAAVFGAVSVWCARAESAAEVLQRLEAAILAASRERGPAVLLLAKDLQQATAAGFGAIPPTRTGALDAPWSPPRALLEPGLALLRARPVLIIAGEEIARSAAREDLARFAELIDARVAVTPDARDAYDNFGSRFVGVAGAMGHSAVAEALSAAAVCVLAGTRLPLLARQGLESSLQEKRVLSLGWGHPFIAPPLGARVAGPPRALLRAFNAELDRDLEPDSAARRDHSLSRAASARGRSHANGDLARPGTPASASSAPAGAPSDPFALTTARVLAALERALPDGVTLIADAGNTGASAVHYLGVPRGGRWLLAMGMAGMGYAYGAAVGAACATGRRTVVCSGDGAFFMHGFEIHTAIEHALPITYLIFNNNAHGMCLVRERLLLREEHGYNVFRPAHIAAGLGAMLPGLAGHDCRTLPELEDALHRTRDHEGPVVIAVELPDVEVPPFTAFRQALEQSAQTHAALRVRGGPP